MTTGNRPPTPSAGRGRTMQDELLHDLRQATPVPIVPTAGEQAASQPLQGPGPRERQAPLLQVQVTVQRWSWPRARVLPGARGLSVGIGPVRVSWTLGGR
ncbi:hypothetical protein SAMN04488546_0324 [Geodermatophilus poikilotrophus]|uniref:Uncharacterized protein n=1 Tax=Geodermatophilus poikilotrophus TaxID=1333667 RepID=A0A1H9YXB6_9ACTN|nr:hypothetical protein SAMN04488546_0324 [Geodermatophilus poikilotrophus]